MFLDTIIIIDYCSVLQEKNQNDDCWFSTFKFIQNELVSWQGGTSLF